MLTPAYKLTFSPPANGGGLLGAGANVAAEVLGGGGKVIDTTVEPQASTVVDLMVRLDMDTPADQFTLLMGQVGRFKPEQESTVTIALGYDEDDELTQVMTGAIKTLTPDLTTRRVIGHSAAAALLHTFVNKTFENKSAGAMVRELAEEAEVETATVQEGIVFPAYVIDGRRSVYHHLRELAELCGFDLYIDSEGKLMFEKFQGGKTVHVFEYTKHIVGLETLQTPPRAGRVESFGESRAGNAGDEAWAWLTKDFSSAKGTTGSGDPLFLLERSALRTREGARTAAQAAMTAIQRQTLRGKMLTIGRPQVKLGDALTLRGMPDDSLNKNFQVRSVTHRITKAGGFMTEVGFRSI